MIKEILNKITLPLMLLLFLITIFLIEHNQHKLLLSLEGYKSNIEKNLLSQKSTPKNILKEEDFYLIYEEDNKIIFILDKTQRKNQSKEIILEANLIEGNVFWSCSKNKNWIFLRDC